MVLMLLAAMMFLGGCGLPTAQMHQIDQHNAASLMHATMEVDDAPIERMLPLVSEQDLQVPKQVMSALHGDQQVRRSVKASGLPMNTFLLSCADLYGQNISVDPSLTAPVSLDLKAVSLPELLDYLAQFYAISAQHHATGWMVRPISIKTHVYHLAQMNMNRWGQSTLVVPRASNQVTATSLANAAGGDAAASSVNATSQDLSMSLASSFDNAKQWEDLLNTLKGLLQDPQKESVDLNRHLGSVTVKAYPETHRLMAKVIGRINYKLSQQVMIEAKILEVNLSQEYSSGVQLNGTRFSYNSKEGVFQYYTAATSFLDVLQLLKQQGRVNILSSPKVSVMHQQRAIIKVGSDVYYATGTSQNSTSNASTTQSNVLVAYQPFFSGLVLDVTPSVDEQDGISMHVHPYVSTVTPDYLNIPLQNNVTGELITNAFIRMASTQIRETDTVIHARSGDMIVIAGLMTRGYNSNHAGPGLKVSTQTQDSASNTEIVILLKPVLMNRSKWKKLLHESVERVEQMERAHV